MTKADLENLTFTTEPLIKACMALPEFAFMAQHLAKKNVDWYIVGGVVRDYALNNSLAKDIDIVIQPQWVDTLVGLLHQQFNSRIVPLDEDLGIYRAINTDDGYYFDIAAMQGHSIEMDLARRDLTVNAIAVNVHNKKLIDPYKGLVDIAEKRLEVISEANFVDDPLRLLRLYRFYAQLDGFSIHLEVSNLVSNLITSKKASLRRVAIERINDELFKLFTGVNAHRALFACVETKVLLDAFPGFSHTVWQKLSTLFNLSRKLDSDIQQAMLKEPILLLWLGLVAINNVQLYDFTTLAERYKWSQLQRGVILRVMTSIAQNAIPDFTDDFYDSLGENELSFWIFANMAYFIDVIAQEDSAGHDWVCRYNNFWKEGNQFWEREHALPKLLTGADLIKYFKKESGPWVGAALSLLRSAQRQGKVHDYKEALDFLKSAFSSSQNTK